MPVEMLTLYQKSYDFLVWLFNKTDGFPKSKRFSIGGRIENKMLDFVTLVHQYQFTPKNTRSPLALSRSFDEIKLLVKICYDTRLISRDSFAFALGYCDQIGAMIGGLVKASGKKLIVALSSSRQALPAGDAAFFAAVRGTTTTTTCAPRTGTGTTRRTGTTTTAFG